MTNTYINDGVVTIFALNNGDMEDMGYLYHNRSAQNACVAENGGNCRVFSRQFKELIDKSAYRDKLYNLLPKPRNQ